MSKTALVLSGGSVKGAFQAGAIRAVLETKQPDYIYGISVGALKDEDAKFVIQQSHTKNMNAVFEEFKKTVSQKEGTVRSNWNVDSPTYQEFFPLGVTEYSTSTLANVELLMYRMVTASKAHEKELDEAFINFIQARFISARTAQLQKKGQVSESKDATASKRDNLERQLMKNLLTFAIEYMGNPDRGIDFFDQSFIHKVGGKEEEEGEKHKKRNLINYSLKNKLLNKSF